MHRFHVHLHVDDIEESVRFYSTVFGAPPTVLKADYAKWMLDDPRVNLAISHHEGLRPGLDHLGIQADTDTELRMISARLKSAGALTLDQEAVTCCYAKGNKSWINDPAGVRWETFFTFSDATTYGEDRPGRTVVSSADTDDAGRGAAEGTCCA
jgi:catechol 2,3-dioxygenase-like lactoylglutathione lyase family enzyme